MKQEPVSIFHFNSTCEMAIANGSPHYTAPTRLRELEKDLSPLMLFFAKQKDIVLTNEPLSKPFLKMLEKAEIYLPSFMCLSDLKELLLNKETINKYIPQPWGKSPVENTFFKNLLPESNSVWFPEMKYLFERKTSLHFLEKFLTSYPNKEYPENIPFLIEKVPLPKINFQEIILKSPLSSSGRGLRTVRNGIPDNDTLRWMNMILKKQGYLTGEQRYKKIADFSFQFYVCGNHSVKYIKNTWFKTNDKGQYKGHILNAQLPEEAIPLKTIIRETGEKLCQSLSLSDYSMQYTGYLSIDAFLYIENNKIKIHPCVEINPRYNMGILSRYIEKNINPTSKGFFEIYYNSGCSYSTFVHQQEKINPIKISNHLMTKGFLSLTDYKKDCNFGAYIILN